MSSLLDGGKPGRKAKRHAAVRWRRRLPRRRQGGADGVAKLSALVTGYMKSGGQQLRINVIDLQTLRNAQLRPEEYQSFIVRVAGFNAYFTLPGRDVQEEIIARTEHCLA